MRTVDRLNNEAGGHEAEALLRDIRELHSVMGFTELRNKVFRLLKLSACLRHSASYTIEKTTKTMLGQLGRLPAQHTRATAWVGKV